MKTKLVQKVATVISIAAALSLGTLREASAGVLNLTGASVFDINGSGTYIGHGSDTTGNDGVFNLYLLTEAGSFLNSGDGPATSLNQDISNPGTYTFFYRTDGGGFNWPTPFAGLNLFFNNGTNPGISVLVPFNIANPALTAFGNSSLGVAGDVVPGANSLSFIAGGLKVMLTAFSLIDYLNPSVPSPTPDLVSPIDNVPNGINDYFGRITLQVSPGQVVSEPGTLALVGLALGCLATAERRRKSAQNAYGFTQK